MRLSLRTLRICPALLVVIGLSMTSAATAVADDSREFAKFVDRYLVDDLLTEVKRLANQTQRKNLTID